jgi:hypothetical protein
MKVLLIHHFPREMVSVARNKVLFIDRVGQVCPLRWNGGENRTGYGPGYVSEGALNPSSRRGSKWFLAAGPWEKE